MRSPQRPKRAIPTCLAFAIAPASANRYTSRLPVENFRGAWEDQRAGPRSSRGDDGADQRLRRARPGCGQVGDARRVEQPDLGQCDPVRHGAGVGDGERRDCVPGRPGRRGRHACRAHPADAVEANLDVVEAERLARSGDRVHAPAERHRPRRRQRGRRGHRRGGRRARAAARARRGQKQEQERGQAADCSSSRSSSSTSRRSVATDSPSIDRHTSPTPTPSSASISCRPIEKVTAVLVSTL